MPAQWSRWFAAAAAAAALGACGGANAPAPASGAVEVVAAESTWGSIAAQVGGAHVRVTSIITNPDADPHDYEPTPADARTMARAGYAIVNGAGYDEWASKLVAANPSPDRQVLTVAGLLGRRAGDNPHFWYSPDAVARVVERIAADLQRVDPAHAADYDRAGAAYLAHGLAGYHDAIAAIRQRYAGTPVGASESIFEYLAPALGLELVTPPGFLRAVTEGTEVSVADKAAVQRQVAGGQIRLYVLNIQNVTPDVRQVVDQVRVAHIPVAEITETPAPAGATFQDWQTGQLRRLLGALGG
jgi:zinc/manganese transport system substrate-binding protein